MTFLSTGGLLPTVVLLFNFFAVVAVRGLVLVAYAGAVAVAAAVVFDFSF